VEKERSLVSGILTRACHLLGTKVTSGQRKSLFLQGKTAPSPQSLHMLGFDVCQAVHSIKEDLLWLDFSCYQLLSDSPVKEACEHIMRSSCFCRQKVEYKYVVKDSTGVLKEWQPGGNCAVAVPTGWDGSLQVADDWHGKSRSVIFKNGEVESAPAGTFDGPPAQASSATIPVSNTDSSSFSSDHSHVDAESNGAVSVSTPQLVTPPGIEANGSQQIERTLIENTEHGTEDVLMEEQNGAALEALTVKDLKDKLKGRGLLVSGRKAELVDRLAAAKTE